MDVAVLAQVKRGGMQSEDLGLQPEALEVGVCKRPGAGLPQALIEPVKRLGQVLTGARWGSGSVVYCLWNRTWPSSRPVTSSAEAAARSSASTAAKRRYGSLG